MILEQIKITSYENYLIVRDQRMKNAAIVLLAFFVHLANGLNHQHLHRDIPVMNSVSHLDNNSSSKTVALLFTKLVISCYLQFTATHVLQELFYLI